MKKIEIKNVSKSYYNHVALRDVNFSIEENSIFGLLGPNGAGKTSLIRIINQIIAPDSGEVFIDGRPLSKEDIGQIGYLPEERGLYKKMKVGEQLLYLAQLKGLDKKDALEKAKEWFRKFEIQEWWDKKVEDLSKGMQQKVQFISTVLHEPKLLILDEPFSGFDPINTNLIKSEINELREKGTTIIFSTHNMASVEEICDEIVLINQSQKILEGPVHEIRDSYKKGIYEISFKDGNMVQFTNALWTGFKLVESETNQGITTAIVSSIGNHTANQLLQAVIPTVEVVALKEVVPSMNDIFIEKVNELNQNGKN